MEPNQQEKQQLRNIGRSPVNAEDMADAQFFQDESELIAAVVSAFTRRPFVAADLEAVERRAIPGIDAYLLFFSGSCLGMVCVFPAGRPGILPSFVFTPMPGE